MYAQTEKVETSQFSYTRVILRRQWVLLFLRKGGAYLLQTRFLDLSPTLMFSLGVTHKDPPSTSTQTKHDDVYIRFIKNKCK